MKNFIVYFVISSAISITGGLIYAKYYLSPKLKQIIEAKASEAVGAPVTIKDLRVLILPKISIAGSGVKFSLSRPKLDVKISRIYVSLPLSLKLLNKNLPLGPFRIQIEEPTVDLEIPAAKSENSAKPANPITDSQNMQITGIKFARDLSIEVIVERARIRLNRLGPDKTPPQQIFLEPLDFELHIPGIEKNWNLSLKTHAYVGQDNVSLNLPIYVTSDFSFKDFILSTTKSSGNFGGILFDLSGEQDLSRNIANWKLAIDIDELAKLKVPPNIIPATNWSGGIKAHLNAINNDSKNWQFLGDIKLSQVAGLVHFERADLSLNGGFRFDLDTRFSVLKSLKIDNLNLVANLDSAEIIKDKLFSKPKGIPLSFNVNLSGGFDKFFVQNCRLQFANLMSLFEGSIAIGSGQNSDLTMRIQPTELSGWESFFPFLKDRALTGRLELNGAVHGQIDHPEALSLELRPLKLEKIKGHIQYVSVDGTQKFSGPFEFDSDIRLKTHARDIEEAKVLMDANFTEMALIYKDLFLKKKGENFKLKIAADKNQNGIEFARSSIEFLHSLIFFKGRISEPDRPKLNFNFSLAPVEIEDAISLLPQFSKYKIVGNVKSNFNLVGQYDFKDAIQKSPLNLNGNISLMLPNFEYVSPAKVASDKADSKSDKTLDKMPDKTTDKATDKATAKVEPILPPWPILQTAHLKIDAKINKFHFDDLLADGMSASAQLESGIFSVSELKFNQIFAGQINLKDFKTDLKKALPDANGTINFSHVDTNQALSFMNPSYKNILKAQASGSVNFYSVHPAQSDFMLKLRAAGKTELKNTTISSMQIDDIINDKISKIPGVGKSKPVESKALATEMTLEFNLLKTIFNILNFKMLTPEKNELIAKGSVEVPTKNMSLQGIAYLANAPVGGDVRAANSDAQGRFVIPFSLQGNLMKPEASLAQKSIEEILKNTLAYIAKRETENLKKDLKDNPKKAIQNKVDQLKKGLEGLFKN